MIVITLFFLIASLFFMKVFYKKKMYFELSFFFSGVYFLYIPLIYVFIFGYLPIPMEFSEIRVPDIYYKDFSYEIAIVSGFWFLFNALIALLNFIYPNSIQPTKNFTDRDCFSFFMLYEVLAISVFVQSGLLDADAHWARSKEDFMHNEGTSALLLIFCTAGVRYLVVAMLAYKMFIEEKWKTFSVLLLIVSLTDIYTTGNRITFLVVLVLVFINLVIFKKKKILILGAIISVPLGFFMTMYRILRSQLHSEDTFIEGFSKGWYLALDNMHLDSKIVLEFVSGVTESINLNVLLAILKDYGPNVDYIYGLSYFKSLVWWIPRSIYEDKPESITVTAARYYAPNSDGSLVATAIGEAYINFSYFGALLLPFLIFSFKKVILLTFGKYRVIDFLLVVYGFILFRMAFSDLFVYLLFSFLILCLYSYFLKIRVKF
jgi:hypothetical protein